MANDFGEGGYPQPPSRPEHQHRPSSANWAPPVPQANWAPPAPNPRGRPYPSPAEPPSSSGGCFRNTLLLVVGAVVLFLFVVSGCVALVATLDIEPESESEIAEKVDSTSASDDDSDGGEVEPDQNEASEPTTSTSEAEEAEPEADSTTTSQAESTTSTSARPPVPEPYSYELMEVTDVSFAAANRQSVSIELKTFPIDRERLLVTLDSIAQGYAGVSHAVAIQVYYDRREDDPPAFGAWQWAPNGQWADADQGDPDDWSTYRWSEVLPVGKIDEPGPCTPPAESELEILGEFWPRLWETDETEDQIKSDLAGQFDTTVEEIDALLIANAVWNAC